MQPLQCAADSAWDSYDTNGICIFDRSYKKVHYSEKEELDRIIEPARKEDKK
jgi:hypothetical protein